MGGWIEWVGGCGWVSVQAGWVELRHEWSTAGQEYVGRRWGPERGMGDGAQVVNLAGVVGATEAWESSRLMRGAWEGVRVPRVAHDYVPRDPPVGPILLVSNVPTSVLVEACAMAVGKLSQTPISTQCWLKHQHAGGVQGILPRPHAPSATSE